jgi:hypothetical protein
MIPYIIEYKDQFLENWTYRKDRTDQLNITFWTMNKFQAFYFSDEWAAQSFIEHYNLKDVTVIPAP